MLNLHYLPPVIEIPDKISSKRQCSLKTVESLKMKFLLVILKFFHYSQTLDLILRIPEELLSLKTVNGNFRLDYTPNLGYPIANTTFEAKEIKDMIEFTDILPGSEYHFNLYFSNSSLADWLTWNASILTTPDPPFNMSVEIQDGKNVLIKWDPPVDGNFTGIELNLTPLTVPYEPITIRADMVGKQASNNPIQLTDLTPGATYEIKMFSKFSTKISSSYIMTNFTTKPNNPSGFINQLRNETAMVVFWEPAKPSGVFTEYKITIDPPDAKHNELLIPKSEATSPHPQAPFVGLFPGRAYNVSVQTVSEDQYSDFIIGQFRTVPWKPHNVSFSPSKVTSNSFEIIWLPPKEKTEFDHYQVSIESEIFQSTKIIDRNATKLVAKFTENIEPGNTYQVTVKTISGDVASWPSTINVTTLNVENTDVLI